MHHGLEDSEETRRSCEVNDPRSGAWTKALVLNLPCAGARVAALGGWCLLAFSRYNADTALTIVELFDPEANRWTVLDTMMQSNARCERGVTTSPKGPAGLGSKCPGSRMKYHTATPALTM